VRAERAEKKSGGKNGDPSDSYAVSQPSRDSSPFWGSYFLKEGRIPEGRTNSPGEAPRNKRERTQSHRLSPIINSKGSDGITALTNPKPDREEEGEIEKKKEKRPSKLRSSAGKFLHRRKLSPKKKNRTLTTPGKNRMGRKAKGLIWKEVRGPGS